ncbi:MAG: shikimate kinase AroK [Gammaproteobacteria bacterium]|nr:shikimate kinase AroK [Gammaproteobacteria bacterium]
MGRVKTNIFLIGPMGAGKSTIGRQVASLLRLEFADSDREIQRRTGVDIPTIFDFEGEEGFRKREKAAIDDLTQREGQVLATGGGVVLDSENRRNLSSRGFVIYLECSPMQQYERTMRDKNRPLLQTENPLETLESLMGERDPLYRATADLIVSTENRSAQAVAKEIVRRLDEE